MEETEVKRMESMNVLACEILDEVEFKNSANEIKAIEAVSGYLLELDSDLFLTLEKKRMKWSLQTFPEATVLSSLVKAEIEIAEVKSDIENGIRRTEEYVDVLMCVLDSAGRAGITVEEILFGFREKLEKNMNRKWIKNEDNTYSHQKN